MKWKLIWKFYKKNDFKTSNSNSDNINLDKILMIEN